MYQKKIKEIKYLAKKNINSGKVIQQHQNLIKKKKLWEKACMYVHKYYLKSYALIKILTEKNSLKNTEKIEYF